MNILPIVFLRLLHCKCVHLLLYSFIYVVYYSIVYYYFAMQPLAQEFPSGLIKFDLSLSYVRSQSAKTVTHITRCYFTTEGTANVRFYPPFCFTAPGK